MCYFALNLNRSSLSAHTKNMHVDEALWLDCDVCEKRLKTKAQLKQHMKQVHGPPGPKQKLLCDTCGKEYSSKIKLEGHVRIVHMGIRDYECVHCGIKFTAPTCLKSHVLAKHTDDAPGYPCTICGKVFKLKDYLKQHLRSTVHGGPGLSRRRRRVKQQQAPQNVPTMSIHTENYVLPEPQPESEPAVEHVATNNEPQHHQPLHFFSFPEFINY